MGLSALLLLTKENPRFLDRYEKTIMECLQDTDDMIRRRVREQLLLLFLLSWI